MPGDHAFPQVRARFARPAGLEPATACLEGRCSIQLSYGRPPQFGRSKRTARLCVVRTKRYRRRSSRADLSWSRWTAKSPRQRAHRSRPLTCPTSAAIRRAGRRCCARTAARYRTARSTRTGDALGAARSSRPSSPSNGAVHNVADRPPQTGFRSHAQGARRTRLLPMNARRPVALGGSRSCTTRK